MAESCLWYSKTHMRPKEANNQRRMLSSVAMGQSAKGLGRAGMGSTGRGISSSCCSCCSCCGVFCFLGVFGVVWMKVGVL